MTSVRELHRTAVAAGFPAGDRDPRAVRDTVLAAMTEGVILFDPRGSVDYANRAARMILGREFSTAAELSPPALHDSVRDMIRRGAAHGEASPALCQVEVPGKSVEATVLPADAQGSVVVLLRDVTRARAVDRVRRDFVANASHELKTPVASILSLSEALRTAARDDPGAVQTFLGRLEGEANRLAALVQGLLELSRLEAGPPDRTRVQLDEVVAGEVERIAPRADAAGIDVSITTLEPARVEGSELDLAHMTHNLLDNAVRYTPEGGRVTVALRTTARGAELTVRDTGIGIAARDHHRIFERFYRVDGARSRQTGGTGLGLSIVRHVVDSHGGTIRVASALDEGSTFTVSLPPAT